MIIIRQHTTKPIETDGEEDRVVEQDHQILDTVTDYRVILFKMYRFFGKLYKSQVNFSGSDIV